MKTLQRSPDNKWLAGLCGGLGKSFDVDPVIVRLIVIAATLATGFLPLAVTYVVGWFIVPEEGSETASSEDAIPALQDSSTATHAAELDPSTSQTDRSAAP